MIKEILDYIDSWLNAFDSFLEDSLEFFLSDYFDIDFGGEDLFSFSIILFLSFVLFNLFKLVSQKTADSAFLTAISFFIRKAYYVVIPIIFIFISLNTTFFWGFK